MDFEPGQRVNAPHPEYASRVEAEYLGLGGVEDRIRSNHPLRVSRERLARVRFEDREYLVPVDSLKPIS